MSLTRAPAGPRVHALATGHARPITTSPRMFALDPMLVAAGAGTGALVGLTGVGGGALMTPLLLLVFGVAPISAIGTDLWFAAITKLVAGHVHHRRGAIDWQVARRLWCGSVPACIVTVAWMKLVPVGKETADLLNLAVGLAVLLTAAAMLFQKQLRAAAQGARAGSAATLQAIEGPATVAAGAVLGTLVTLTSVGAGALGAVFLVYLYPRRLTAARLVATDVVHAIPLAICAGAGHLLVGHVDLNLLGNLLIGSIPAAVAGAMLSGWLPQVAVRRALSAILLLSGVKLLMIAG